MPRLTNYAYNWERNPSVVPRRTGGEISMTKPILHYNDTLCLQEPFYSLLGDPK